MCLYLQFVGQCDVLVNCSGLSSRYLFGDEKIIPVRGQTLRVGLDMHLYPLVGLDIHLHPLVIPPLWYFIYVFGDEFTILINHISISFTQKWQRRSIHHGSITIFQGILVTKKEKKIMWKVGGFNLIHEGIHVSYIHTANCFICALIYFHTFVHLSCMMVVDYWIADPMQGIIILFKSP